MCFWKRWEKIKTKHENLVKLGLQTIKLGNMQTQGKATRQHPIGQCYPKY